MATGFYWTANSPYLRAPRFKVRRAPKGLNPSIAMIGPDANPIHHLFEIYTNPDWGMGGSPSLVDTTSFETAAQTIYDEQMGISYQWTGQTEIENIAAEILDHIQATVFTHPRTGLLTVRLLRDDFDPGALLVITPDNATLSNLQRKAWGEIANEVVVTFTNTENQQEETVTVHNLAAIAMQGGEINSTGRNYYMFRNRDLAARVAERDLRSVSQPLASCEVRMNRTGWDITPGLPVKLHWPEKGVDSLIMRVGKVNYGRPGDGAVRFSLSEDIFSLPRSEYIIAPPTSHEPPDFAPSPLENFTLETAPLYVSLAALAIDDPADLTYPEAVTMIAAAPDSPDEYGFELIVKQVQANGATVNASAGTRNFLPSATLSASIPAEAQTEITTFANPTGSTPLAGSLILIGSGGEGASELALVHEVTEAGWTLTRGVLDTVPRAWGAGTRLWVIGGQVPFIDRTIRGSGENAIYRILPKSSQGTLAYEDAADETLAVSARPHLPLRPANVQVNGNGFGPVDVTGLSTVTVTWANRNRETETSQILAWDAAGASPETGQTTTILLLDDAGVEISAIDGLSGSTHDVALSGFGARSSGRLRVVSKRDGLTSLQGHEIALTNIGA